MMGEKKKIKIVTLCNAGKERSRILAASLESLFADAGYKAEVLARGTFGLGNDDKGVTTTYGWVPPEGFVNLLKLKGINMHTYPSQRVTEEEAREAEYLIAVDSTIAERMRNAHPEFAGKTITALEAIDQKYNPFHKYLGHDIPDAWGGHLAKNVREILHKEGHPTQKLSEIVEVLGESLDENAKAFVREYRPDAVAPTDIKRIPRQLRDYMGHKLDSDQAYWTEVDNLRKVAQGLVRRLTK